MKKTAIIVIAILLMTGCSARNVHKEPDKTTVAPVLTTGKEEQEFATQEPGEQLTTQPQITDKKQSTVETEWFEGAIGNSKIHAKFDFSDKDVYGVYYYDQYKTDIKLEGFIAGYTAMRDYQTVSLTEDTDKKGNIVGVFRSKDYFQGYWESGDVIYPMYLIREGSDITPPKPPSAEIMKFDGLWTGNRSNYFAGSEADIKVLFDDLIHFELNAFSGANSGWLSSFAIVENGSAKAVFKDTTYIGDDDNVFFEFRIENDLLKLNSNRYDYGCGAGVGFDSEYVYGKKEISMPTALEVGIVETEEQEKVFRELVGDRYEDFITYTVYVGYSEVMMDGEKVKAGASFLRGAHGNCFYIISPKYIYAAIVGFNEIYYYTNDKKYANKIPEPMAEWAKGIDKIIYKSTFARE